MYEFLLTLHITAASIVVGTLFLQSLGIVMALRLKTPEQQEGARHLQRRMHAFITYPVLAVTLLTGAWLAYDGEALSQGKWLHWKLVFVVVLIGLGLLVGNELRGKRVVKPAAMVIHILILFVSGFIVYLAAVRPL